MEAYKSFESDNNYNATENVRAFIGRFFPNNYNRFPSLIWDGIRNALVHTLFPKKFKFQHNIIRIQFYVDDRTVPAHVTVDDQNNNIILMKINCFELHEVIRIAISNYRTYLESEENSDARDNFIKAWSSIEHNIRLIPTGTTSPYEREATILTSMLADNDNHFSLLDQDRDQVNENE